MTDKLVLNDVFKQSTHDLDKTLPPEETVRRFKDRIAQLNLHILDEVVRIDNGRLGIPVYMSYCGPDAETVTGTRKQMGKGATPEQAEASAVMELGERFSFFSYYHNPGNFIIDTCENLKDRALSFKAVARSVHDTSEDRDQARKIFESLPLRWARGYSLTEDKPILIPFDWFFTINEFNGACAGNCVEEALNQGICEVVERHVSSVVSRGRLNVPGIQPDSVSDPVVREMIEKFKRAGVRIHLSDFSLDTGIPTVGVLAWDPETFPEKSEIVWTAGTTPNPQKALCRALSETAQLGGDFNSGSNFLASGLPKFTDIDEARYITRPEATLTIDALPDLSHNNLKIEILNLLSALSRHDMNVLAVDVTHEKLGIPAFYTIIPGAHFRERAEGGSVGMFCAKLIAEKNPAPVAIMTLMEVEHRLPDKYYIQFYLGTAYLEMGETETALTCFQKSLDLNPEPQDVPSIYSFMGVCLKDLERYQDALTVLEKGIRRDPTRTDLYNLKGFCHFKLKQHEQAIESFKAVLRIDPGSAIDYANIAVNYRDMGNTEQAIFYFQMALSLDSSIDFARDGLEKLLSGTKHSQ
ncbi:YcaO-like family protein [Desulfococcus multivorans]|uniref:YcaO-domain protein n=1 Tax=Desulfococcus multivorans DSM 2059 TaxID=1121405 RepID=S7U639_DESML|nr:YcaO-like family protein [Desulfococcus multivorans]AOY59184.1 conserved uncharacterized protein [Desulfococcus multivorans]AQV01411.1 hypothetical protein B2D07_12040 [Desulfococcus multivorans]EPR44991.1 YcaO-domain protein [Desulfococcus multivorans DSM 2059]SJZ85122.1 ribosomal protein S12 methylthiotransferase accessory factor [Desulfococcus multivorans DSM 2059]